MKLTGF